MTVYTPPCCDISLLHEDEFLIVMDKPSGLLSVPGRGPEKADCARTRLQAIHPEALTVHRLDMSTSGLLLFARSKDMQRALSGLFEQGQVEKAYLAEVWGTPAPAKGEVDLPLITDWPNRPRQKVDTGIGKPSRTRFETLSSCGQTTRVALTPLTGRSHQLRVHMAEIGHPILGDDLYAHDAARQAAPRLHLHAACLSFPHPGTGERLHIESPCPF